MTGLDKYESRSVFGLNPFLVQRFLWGNETHAPKKNRKYLDMDRCLVTLTVKAPIFYLL